MLRFGLTRLARARLIAFGSSVSGPALSLNFLSGALDGRITFTRGSLATLVDSTGKVTYAPNNLAIWSEQFDNAAWTTYSGASGSGKQLTFPTSAAYFQQGIPGVYSVGDTFILSFIASIPSGSITLSTQLTDSADGVPVYQLNSTVTSTPTRITQVATMGAGFSGALAVLIFGAAGTPINTVVTVSELQVEKVTYQTAARPYNRTYATGYYGPRFDYNPSTLVARGLLIEESRTNNCKQSADWSNALYIADFSGTGSVPLVTGNFGVAPDGTTTAARVQLNKGAGVGFSRIQQTITGLASTNYIDSVYLKTNDASTKSVVLRNNGDAALFTVTGTWTRFSVLGAPATVADIQVMLWDSLASSQTADLLIWGGQAEQGAFPTSYIPTTGAAVTRSQDLASMTGTNFSSWFNASAGTFVVVFDCPVPASGSASIISSSGGAAFNVWAANQHNYYNGTTSLIATTPNPPITIGVHKLAAAYDGTGRSFAEDGGTVATDAAASGFGVNLYLGSSVTPSAWIDGHIQSITYYNTRKTNAEIVALST